MYRGVGVPWSDRGPPTDRHRRCRRPRKAKRRTGPREAPRGGQCDRWRRRSVSRFGRRPRPRSHRRTRIGRTDRRRRGVVVAEPAKRAGNAASANARSSRSPDPERARIGKWPRGRGVLGDLILDPVPLRLANLGEHPHRYEMPPGHPPMRSFLGVPIRVDHVPDGSLYLTEKAGGRSFTGEDQEAVVSFAGFAGLAIERDRRQTSAGTV